MSPITHMCQGVMCRGYHRTPRPDRRFLTLARHGTWEGLGSEKRPKRRVRLMRGTAAPGCSSCSQPISILHGPPLAMSAPYGRFRAAVRWLQVGTQVGTTGGMGMQYARTQGHHWDHHKRSVQLHQSMLCMSPITHMCQEVMCRGYHRKPRPDRHFQTLVRHGTWRDWAAKSVPNGRDGSCAAAAAPGCSSCSQPISILHGPPLALNAPCGRFRAGVRWLQVGTQL